MTAHPGCIDPMKLALVTRDPALVRWLEDAAATERFFLDHTSTPDGHFLARAAACDMTLVDTPPGDESALEALDTIVGADLPAIAIADGGSVTHAVATMRRGAKDFILRPAAPGTLIARLRDMRGQSAKPVAHSGKVASPASDFESFVGRSPSMRDLYRQIAQIAPSSAPVFVTGESGTGKELCATALHKRSGRASGRFIAINCAAIPRDLMESELFGHVRGAFTGAHDDRDGALQRADGGTLFLDEICEMDVTLQAKLLRVLQTGLVSRVGDDLERAVDVRVICATNRDPEAEIEAGRFRGDLYFRLHVLPLHLPALRERADDVMALANAFLERYAAEEGRHFSAFDGEARRFLEAYDWPGNVRQLENLVRRVVVMNDGPMVTRAMIPLALAHSGARANVPAAQRTADNIAAFPHNAANTSVEAFAVQERRIIEAALEAHGGHVGKAAAALDISPSTIYRKKLAWDADTALSA